MRIQRSASVSPRRRSISPARCKTTKKKDNKICKSLTRLLRSRSPSPNATKHLCQFCKENQQQQSRLSLGSPGYKLDAETRPPFVVRHVSLKIAVLSYLGDMIEVYKIMTGMKKVNREVLFLLYHNTRTSGHPMK
uniref:Uncharacterized protein n=1 Tax=Chelonoidis abingdonii TaxID=106734 RepID=A0A8C0J412_CHEAB